MSEKLKDIFPEVLDNPKTKAYKYRDSFVTKFHEGDWIGDHTHVYFWVELVNDLAIGFNEADVYSFPVRKIKQFRN